MDGGESAEEKAQRLKALAEDRYRNGELKPALKCARRALRLSPNLDGVSEMLTAFKILRSADGSASPDWYEILQVEPFSHINSIKKQYRNLALTLHPDKNPFPASEEAFKLVADAFRCLSDKGRRKEYDLKLRLAMQSSAAAAAAEDEAAGGTFWTACARCRLLHQFERRYVGHKLMCPNCNKSFLAVEADDASGSGGEGDQGGDTTTTTTTNNLSRVRSRVSRARNVGSKRKMGSVEEVLKRAHMATTVRSLDKEGERNSGGPKRGRLGKEMTLAEMQVEAMRKLRRERATRKKEETEKESKRDKERRRSSKIGSLDGEKQRAAKEKDLTKIYTRRSSNSKQGNSEMERLGELKGGDSEVMDVEDSDFYDFDKGRVERSFKKGQVWALYDDDDGMPRHYGLIEEVVSVKPFEVTMSWLDLQNSGDEGLVCLEGLGFHISCGKFKVSRKTSIDSVNVFSHPVDCERAARELYRIYPKKGSVWALYNEQVLEMGGRDPSFKEKRCYDIVVFLTSYSEMHGLSMAYLEKVDGFKTVFKRKEIGCHAIRCIEKDDVRLVSHQIPARKLSGTEDPELPKDCWELDPASLPPELLSIQWRR